MTRAVTSLRVQVMAWELLTGVNLFGNKPSMRDAVDVLSGLRPLPTEMPLTAQARTGLSATPFRQSVLAMLSRAPARRPGISEVVKCWMSVFQGDGTAE